MKIRNERNIRTAQLMGRIVEQMNVSQETKEMIMRADVLNRHKSRVNYLTNKLDDFLQRVEYLERDAYKYALCILEVNGIGGHINGGQMTGMGASTKRSPLFEECGKGRRHASDAAAWDAAIEEVGTGYSDLIPVELEEGIFLAVVDYYGQVIPLFQEEIFEREFVEAFCIGKMFKELSYNEPDFEKIERWGRLLDHFRDPNEVFFVIGEVGYTKVWLNQTKNMFKLGDQYFNVGVYYNMENLILPYWEELVIMLEEQGMSMEMSDEQEIQSFMVVSIDYMRDFIGFLPMKECVNV